LFVGFISQETQVGSPNPRRVPVEKVAILLSVAIHHPTMVLFRDNSLLMGGGMGD